MQKPIDEFKNRFNKILFFKAIKPVELAEKTGLSKSTISHYMSGYTKPKSDRLYMLAKALNVNEAWLMGYDVPMERDSYEDQNIITFDAILDKVMDIFENSKYKISLSDDFDCDIIIKDQEHKILACMHDYDLVARHESLRKAGKEITAEAILQNFSDTFTPAEKSHIEKYRTLDSIGKEIVSFVLNKEAERMADLERHPAPTIDLSREPSGKCILAYYGKIAAAGKSFEFNDVTAGTIECPLTRESQRADYAIGISGDSMEPTFYDGDIVYVKKDARPEIGDIGIFQKDNGIYIKEVGENKLISHNTKYKPIVDDGDIVYLGKVIGKVEI